MSGCEGVAGMETFNRMFNQHGQTVNGEQTCIAEVDGDITHIGRVITSGGDDYVADKGTPINGGDQMQTPPTHQINIASQSAVNIGQIGDVSNGVPAADDESLQIQLGRHGISIEF